MGTSRSYVRRNCRTAFSNRKYVATESGRPCSPGRPLLTTRRLAALAVMGRTPLVVTRARPEAADPQNESLFTVRAALKRALAIRRDADLQVEQLRALVDRLEAERRPGI